MTSLASAAHGGSILHIANRLGEMQKGILQTQGERQISTTPPICDINENNDDASRITIRLFKDKERYTTSPSTACTSASETSTSSCDAKQDLVATLAHIQQQFHNNNETRGESEENFSTADFCLQAASYTQQEHNDSDPSTPNSLEQNNGVTMRDLMPTYSPWMRNAGRKKSHPVWDFFKDMKESTGSGGVICLACSWQGDDRSPNNLRTHLKKFHTQDGIFAKFSQKLAQTPTQPYVKRARAGGFTPTSLPTTPQPAFADSAVAIALQQFQSQHLPNPLNFLDNLPKSNEVINISAGFNGKEEEDNQETHEPGSSGTSAVGSAVGSAVERASSDSPVPVEDNSAIASGGSPSVSSTNQLSAFLNMNMATNPLMWNMLNVSSHGSAFSLNDGQCVSTLMKMTIDLDLTMSYHKRRGDIELCFESNRTAEKSGGRGKVLCLFDIGREIRVTERVNGTPTDSELWTKTDFNQFHWAIRGKLTQKLSTFK